LKNLASIAIETPTFWDKNYELIDSGGFEKLEQFGAFVVRRPEPQAVWQKSLSEEFWASKANAYFKKEKGSTERGVWEVKKGVPDKWFMPYKSETLDLNFKISLSSFKHVGIFPEQASNWEFLAKNIPLLKTPKPKILNLFAYTGGASLASRWVQMLHTWILLNLFYLGPERIWRSPSWTIFVGWQRMRLNS
jgi:23S rRNA (cytosine1962-C5)-methyltransferase